MPTERKGGLRGQQWWGEEMDEEETVGRGWGGTRPRPLLSHGPSALLVQGQVSPDARISIWSCSQTQAQGLTLCLCPGWPILLLGLNRVS